MQVKHTPIATADIPVDSPPVPTVTDCLRMLRQAAKREGMSMTSEIGNGKYRPALMVELWPSLDVKTQEGRK